MLNRQQDATEHSKTRGLDGAEDEPASRGRPRRAAQQNRIKAKAFAGKHPETYDSLGSMDDESDATSSGNEWREGGDEDEPDDQLDEEEDEDVDMSDNSGSEDEDDSRQSLVVSLRYVKGGSSPPNQDTRNGPAISGDHNIPSMATYDSKGPSSAADGPNKASHDASKPTQDAAPPLYSRSIQQPQLLRHAVPTEQTAHALPTDPRPQVGHSGANAPIAPHDYRNAFQSNHSQSEEHSTPTA